MGNGAQPRRNFLGWDEPALVTASRRLFDECVADDGCDLSGLVIGLPTGSAIRRLQELLAVEADRRRCVLIPPELVTVGQLPERFYRAKFPFASDMVQVLAWSRALQQTSPRALEGILPLPSGPAAGEQWLELGKLLAGVHRDLAGDLLNFSKVADTLKGHPEAHRWRKLAAVQERYLRELDALELWDIQTARMVALEKNEARCDRRVILLGAVDLTQALRKFVEAVGECVEVWIAAPEKMNGMFDAVGCVNPEAWDRVEIDVPAACLLVGNSPADQCELAAACLAELGNTYHAREITIGVPDAALVPSLHEHLLQCGCEARFGAGSPLAASEPARILQAAARYLRTRGYRDLADLIRIPSVSRLVSAEIGEKNANWLSEIDQYYDEVIPRTITDWIQSEAVGAEAYRLTLEVVHRWIRPLETESRSIEAWAEPLLEVLRSVYADRTCDPDEVADQKLRRACEAMSEQIAALSDIPDALRLPMSAGDAIDWLISGAAGRLIPEPSRDSAVEMAGWLDLPLDDAPVLILTGFHDAVVPESINADPFLPNQLRRQLGMTDNARRLARDLYAFSLTLHSRKHLRIIVGRTDASGNPLIPSRLLLTCPLADLPSRVLRLTAEEAVDSLPPVISQKPISRVALGPELPQPIAGKTVQQISVTAFRTYITCPYRFYLKHVLKLQIFDDRESEMDAGAFGDLLHETLQSMHGDPIAASTDAEAIEAFLTRKLYQLADKQYGPHRSAAVDVQLEQARDRLSVFAEAQSAWIAQGWRTEYVEAPVSLDVGSNLGGIKTEVRIIGRIDRIDYHPELDAWAVWDYKSSEGATKPVQAHIQSGKWVDLQLPLYRHLIRSLGIKGTPQLGYILVPKDAKECRFITAEFTDEQLLEADRLAATITRSVAGCKFFPPTSEAVDFDDFSRICRVDVQNVVTSPPIKKVADHRSEPRWHRSVASAVVKEARLRTEGFDDTARLEAPPLPPLMIRASAGTGKTYQLSNRLLYIILSGQSVDPILAVTFTRKAAGEILQRVLKRLAEACLEQRALDDLRRALPQLEFDQAECLIALRRVTKQLHRFRVSTLDSFYSQLARTFSLELQLPAGWSTVDPVRESSLRMQAVQRMLDSSDRRLLNSLVKMLAKGESRRNVARDIEETVKSGYQLYRAAPEDAWGSLAIPSSPDDSLIRDAIELMRSYDPGHKSAKKKLDELAEDVFTGNWEKALTNGFLQNALAGQPYYRHEAEPSLLACFKTIKQKCAAELLPPHRAQALAGRDLLAAFDSEYMNLLRRNRVLTFSDVTYLLAEWVEKAIAGAEDKTSAGAIDRRQLRLRLDCGIDHMLLDEFQDTSPDQWRILEPLAKPLTGSLASERSFFVVGDTKQAIYGWRGGVAEIFDTVTSSLPNIVESELMESYRSSPIIIDFVNQVFRQLDKHTNFGECETAATRWSRAFPLHQTAKRDLPGYVLVQNEPPEEDTESEEQARVEGDPALVRAADQIRELTEQAPGKSVGVLFRDNDNVAAMIALLKARGVSASQEGGRPLTDSAAVQTILSLIHLGDYPGDTRSYYHIQHSPLKSLIPGVAQSALKASQWVRECVLSDGLAATLGRWRAVLEPTVSWWDRHRLTQLLDMAIAFEQQGGGRLREFEQMVEEQRVALPTEAQVKVMTIHASKGLEFDAVFLPNMTLSWSGRPPMHIVRADRAGAEPTGVLRYFSGALQQLLPEPWQEAFYNQKVRTLDETMCLFYVAVTRARQALYVQTVPRRASKGDKDKKDGTQGAVQQCGSILQSIFASPDNWSEPEAVLFEAGKKDWYVGAASATVRAEVPSELQEAPDPSVIALRTDVETSPLRRLAVTRPSVNAAEREHMVLSDVFRKSEVVGAAFGIALHACLEQVKWIEDFRFDERVLIEAIEHKLTPEQLRHVDVKRLLEYFERLLSSAAAQDLLSRRRYEAAPWNVTGENLQLENERRVNLLDDGKLLDGTMDRLVKIRQGGRVVAADIIDFKSDRLPESADPDRWTAERLEAHRGQLTAYRSVTARMLGLSEESITCSLFLIAARRSITLR